MPQTLNRREFGALTAKTAGAAAVAASLPGRVEAAEAVPPPSPPAPRWANAYLEVNGERIPVRVEKLDLASYGNPGIWKVIVSGMTELSVEDTSRISQAFAAIR